MLFSNYYDQAQAIFSARLWSMCLELLIYWACAMFLRLIPLPISIINACFEGYVFPVMTSIGFSAIFRAEKEQIREKHILMIMDEEIDYFKEEEQERKEEAQEQQQQKDQGQKQFAVKNGGAAVTKQDAMLMHVQAAVLHEEERLDGNESGSYFNIFVYDFYVSKDWRVALVTRFVVAVILENLFGGLLDFIYDQVTQAIKLALVFGALFLVFKLYQFWTTIKNLVSGGNPQIATEPQQ